MRVNLKFLPIVMTAFLVSGCGIFSEDSEPLPGERISILAADFGVEVDPELAGQPPQLPRVRQNDSWSQPGGAAGHAMGHLALSDSLSQAWRADIGRGNRYDRQILGEPVVANGRIYTMDSVSTVSAYDSRSGQRVWRRDLTPEDERRGFFGGGVAYEDGRVFVTTGFGRVFALDADSGETIWSRSAGAPMRAGPAVRDGRVIATTVNNRSVALSADDGRELWTHQGIEEEAGLLGTASPAIGEGVVLLPYSSGELFAVLAENGRLLWRDTMGGGLRTDPIASLSDIRGMPVIDRGRVFAVSNANRAVGIDLQRGARAWEREIGSTQMPWVANGELFLVSNRAQVVAMEAETGRVRWMTHLEQYQRPDERRDAIEWHGPVLAGERLILAGSHGEAVMLSPQDGSVLNSISLPSGATVPPVVADGTLYILTEDATLVAYR